MACSSDAKRCIFEGCENSNFLKFCSHDKTAMREDFKNTKSEEPYNTHKYSLEDHKIQENEHLINEFISKLNSENFCDKSLHLKTFSTLCLRIGNRNVQNVLLPLFLEKIDFCEDWIEELGEEILQNFHFFMSSSSAQPALFLFVNRFLGKREVEIKEKGISMYSQMIFNLSDNFFMQKCKNEIVKLAKHRGEEYRIASASILLIALKKIIQTRNEELIKYFIFIYCELLKDKFLLVKRAAVKMLPKYFEILKILSEKDFTWTNVKISEAFEILLDMSTEEKVQEEVRIMTCYAVESFVYYFSTFTFDKIFKIIQTLYLDSSWRVRCAVVNLLEKIFSMKYKNENFEKKCLPIYINLLKDRDTNVKSISVEKLGKITKCCENPIATLNLIGVNFLKKECEGTASPYVKLSMISMIADIRDFFDKTNSADFLIPIVETLLQDEECSIKVKALSIFPMISDSINTLDIENTFIPLFRVFSNSLSWRVRCAVLQVAGNLILKFGTNNEEYVTEKLFHFITNAFYDNVWWIRKESSECISQILQKFHGSNWINAILLSEIEKMHLSMKYAIRVQALQLITAVISSINVEFFQHHILKFVEILLKDKISNVRLNVVKCLQKIRKEFRDKNLQLTTRALMLLKQLKNDEDSDVKFAAEIAIEEVDFWPSVYLPKLLNDHD